MSSLFITVVLYSHANVVCVDDSDFSVWRLKYQYWILYCVGSTSLAILVTSFWSYWTGFLFLTPEVASSWSWEYPGYLFFGVVVFFLCYSSFSYVNVSCCIVFLLDHVWLGEEKDVAVCCNWCRSEE